MQCSDFDVATSEDWRRCGRIRAYVAIAVVIVVVLILVWVFSASGRVGWGIAAVGLLVVGGMAFMLPDYMGEAKASEHAGLWRRVDALKANGSNHNDAVRMVKTEEQLRTLQQNGRSNGNSSNAGAAFTGSLIGSLIGSRR